MAGNRKPRAPSSSSSNDSVLDDEEEKFNENGKTYFSSYDPNKYAHLYSEEAADQAHAAAMFGIDGTMNKLDEHVLYIEN